MSNVDLKKDKHDITITNALVSPNSVKCQRKISIDAEIINTGRENEDKASLQITSPQFGINSANEMGLNEGTTDNSYSKQLNANIGDDIAAGVYPITIKAGYDGKETDSKTLELSVQDCEKSKNVMKEVKAEKPKTSVEKPASKTEPKISNSSIERVSSNNEGYLLLVSILTIIFLGTAVFVIGGAYIVLRK